MTDREVALEFIKRLGLERWSHDAYNLPGGYFKESYDEIQFALSHPGVRGYSDAEWVVCCLTFNDEDKITHKSGWGKTRR